MRCDDRLNRQPFAVAQHERIQINLQEAYGVRTFGTSSDDIRRTLDTPLPMHKRLCMASLGAQLRLLTAKIDGELQAVYDSAGLPFRPRFYPIVQHLLREGSASITALAQATEVTQPAATQTISEMAKLGLVTITSGSNGRARSVSLTAHGQQVSEQLKPIWDAVRDAARELDRELPYPLFDTIAAAIAELRRKPFRDRIRSKVHDG